MADTYVIDEKVSLDCYIRGEKHQLLNRIYPEGKWKQHRHTVNQWFNGTQPLGVLIWPRS